MIVQDKRTQLYLSTIFNHLRTFADKAGIKTYNQSLIGQFLFSETDTERFSDLGYALAVGMNRKSSQCVQDGLSPIFNNVLVSNKINTGDALNVFPVKALCANDDSCFPVSKEKQKVDYSELWNAFEKEFAALAENGQLKGMGFLALLKKYIWCVPADLEYDTTTSLYDTLKTAASFAVCLYDYMAEKADTKIDKAEHPMILLGGDVSGIQKFIYNISSRKAAVSLKGRSFYVQLLVDSVILRICQHPDIQAFASQVVYSSGGKFYMLLPNTAKVKLAIENLKCEIERELFEDHYGQLLLNIAYIPFGFEEHGVNNVASLNFAGYKNAEIGLLWKELTDRLTDCKNQKFKTVLNMDMFKPHKVGANVHVCAVTGVESDMCVPIDPKAKEKTFVLRIVERQAKLGQLLKDAEYIASWIGTCGFQKDITIFGVNFKLIKSSDIANISSEDKKIELHAINNTNCFSYNSQSVDVGFKFYGGNIQARNSYGENKTFEELADGQYLGVLRMDVDNLGAIFIKGLPDSAKNFAAYSTMSFLLDYFFCGYLNSIRLQDKFVDDVNILYSGGDDIFAIGRWDKLILFAETVRNDFERFVGREDISISGGVSFIGDSFPIAKAAQMAGEAEDRAKKHNGGKKNAFDMFGKTVEWGEEFCYVKSKHAEFVDLIKNYKMPKSILHRLMILYEQMHQGDMSYVWHSVYFLKRFSEGKTDEVKSFCYDLQKILCDKRKYELITIAARWAEYELRFDNLKH